MNYNEQNCNCYTLTQQQGNYLFDQTNIQGPLALVKLTCIDRNTKCQIKQLFTQGVGFYVRNPECTGLGIHRVILYVTSGKIPSDQTICSD